MIDPISVMVDLELERNVLGEVLMFGLLDDFLTAGLTADMFYRKEHAMVLKAALDVSGAGSAATLITVGQRLRETGEIDEVQAGYFARMVDGVARPDSAVVLYQIARLTELLALRDINAANTILADRLTRSGALADGAVSDHLDRVQTIVERQHTPGAMWHDVAAQLSSHEREVHDSTTAHRLAFGLTKLDEAIGGVRMGEVCGLMGRPGIGKTVFLSVITRAIADIAGHVFFSLEMPTSQIVGRLKQNLFNMGRRAVEDSTRAGLIDQGLYLRTFDRLVIVDSPGMSVAEMGRRVRQIQKGPLRNIPIRLVTIDHLGLIGGDRSLSTYDRVSVQAREIKELAKRLECAVILAIQVNRDAGGDGSKELSLGSARDSGVVEEAMDYLIGIRRLDRSAALSPEERERYKDVIFAKVIKNRHGDPGHREIAYRFMPIGMDLREDPSLKIEHEDVARLAQQRAGGRR